MGTKVMAEETGVKGAGAKTLSVLTRSKSFLKDVRNEMRKVTTPSTKEVRATTGVVIITLFLFALYFFGVDSVISFVIDKIFAWARA